MDIERIFEVAVLSARRDAQLATDAGFPHRACDPVACALMELWESGRDAGMSEEAIQAIVDRHVELDDAGEAWPRDIAPSVH